MWDKRTIYLFSKKVSPKNRFFRIYEICSWAASKPEMKTDRTCQAGCWGGSVPACSAPHPSACLEGTCQIWLSSHGKWSWCGFDFVCLFVFVGARGHCFLNMDSWIFNRELLHQLYSTRHFVAQWLDIGIIFFEIIMTIWMFCFHFCHIIGLICEVFLRNSCSKLPRLFWIVQAELSKTVWGGAKTSSFLYCSFKWSKYFDLLLGTWN